MVQLGTMLVEDLLHAIGYVLCPPRLDVCSSEICPDLRVSRRQLPNMADETCRLRNQHNDRTSSIDTFCQDTFLFAFDPEVHVLLLTGDSGGRRIEFDRVGVLRLASVCHKIGVEMIVLVQALYSRRFTGVRLSRAQLL